MATVYNQELAGDARAWPLTLGPLSWYVFSPHSSNSGKVHNTQNVQNFEAKKGNHWGMLYADSFCGCLQS